jgi:hypothetical protein
MDRFGVGVPFWLAGILVIATLPLAWALAGMAAPQTPLAVAVRQVAAADVTDEFPVATVPPPGGPTAPGGSPKPSPADAS